MPTPTNINDTEPVKKERKPTITRVSQDALNRKIKFFLKRGIPYVKKSTTERTTIYAEQGWGWWQNKESTFKANELQFIKSVKKYILDNETFKNVRNRFTKKDGDSIKTIAGSTNKIKYFYYNKNIAAGSVFKDYDEIDLKNAYWSMAHFQLGLFDEHIYQRGLTVSKKSRLAAIGALARSVNIVKFDGKKEKVLDPERSVETEFLWHTISYRVGRIMARASRKAGKNFVFFWVDACFVHPNATASIVKMFKDLGFQSTTAKCEHIIFDGKKIQVKCKAKGKWVKVKKREIVSINNHKFIKTYSVKEWKEDRVFPYAKALSEAEIMNLATQ